MIALALIAALHAQPFVDASKVVPGLIVDLRYATPDNFLHHRLYPEHSRCLLRASVARRLAHAARLLRKQGFRLVAWDCYRPISVQRAMWKVFPDPGFVANPAHGSNHNRGAAVDVSLATLEGKPVEMPTGFDSFTPQAHLGAKVSDAARAHRTVLIRAMLAAGFHTILKEWWHYNAPHAKQFAIADVPLTRSP